MKTTNYLFVLVILIFTQFKLVGQEFPEGYLDGRQIIGTKIERNLEGETEWNDKDSTIYEYDAQERLIRKEGLYFNDTIWIAHSRTLFEYETDGKGYVRTDQRFYADVFMEDIHKITQVFNDKNQIVESVEHDWINEAWIRFSKDEYQYDDRGNVINNDFYRFVNNEWKLVYERIFEFDELGNETLSLLRGYTLAGIVTYELEDKIEKDTIGNQIITDFLDLQDGEIQWQQRNIGFLNSNNVVDSTYIYWNSWDTLVLSRKIVHDYNNIGELTQNTTFSLENNLWSPSFLINHEYDNNGYLILEKSFRWLEDENKWIDYFPLQKEYTYTENGTLIKEVDYSALAIEFEPWTAYDRNITYYKTPLSVDTEVIPTDFSIQIFPNPVSQFLSIKLNGKIGNSHQLTIVNLQGQILQRQRLNTNLISLSLDGLPSGTYFVQIRDEFGMVQTSKVVKQ